MTGGRAAGLLLRPLRHPCRVQEDREDAAFSDLALDLQRAPVVAYDMFHDGEPEPGAAELARARGVDPVEALGQARNLLFRDAFALVLHGDRDETRGGDAGERDRRALDVADAHADRRPAAAVFE